MSTRYVRAQSAGTRDGSSWANAAGFGSTVFDDQAALAGPDGLVLLAAQDRYLVTSSSNLTLSVGGTLGHPVTIRGASTVDDTPAYATLASNRAEPYNQNGAAGRNGFTVTGQHINLDYIKWRRIGLCVMPRTGCAYFQMRHHRFRNIRRYVDNAKGAHFVFQDIKGVGFSKQIFRLSGTDDVLIEDIYGDCHGQTGDAYPAGIVLTGNTAPEANTNVVVNRAMFRRLIDEENRFDQYRQGDGISSEPFDGPVIVNDMLVVDASDGLTDMKAGGTFTRVMGRRTKSGFRYWYKDITCNQCAVVEPHQWDNRGQKCFSHTFSLADGGPDARFNGCYFRWASSPDSGQTMWVSENIAGVVTDAGTIHFSRCKIELGTAIGFPGEMINPMRWGWDHSTMERI